MSKWEGVNKLIHLISPITRKSLHILVYTFIMVLIKKSVHLATKLTILWYYSNLLTTSDVYIKCLLVVFFCLFC